MWVWISELERPLGGENGNPLQHSCLENPRPRCCKESDMTEHACTCACTRTRTHTRTHTTQEIYFFYLLSEIQVLPGKLAAHNIYWKNECINGRRKETYQIIGAIKSKVCPVTISIIFADIICFTSVTYSILIKWNNRNTFYIYLKCQTMDQSSKPHAQVTNFGLSKVHFVQFL